MILQKLFVRRSPGIGKSIDLPTMKSGVTIILGPNASGKSSICRIVSQLLWPSNTNDSRSSARGEWTTKGRTLVSDREGQAVQWTEGPSKINPPPLPDPRFANCYRIEMSDLIQGHSTDSEIVLAIRRQMAGGYDVERLRKEKYQFNPNTGNKEKSAVSEAKQLIRKAREKQTELEQKQDRLGELERQIQSAKRAQQELRYLETAEEHQRVSANLTAAQNLLTTFPPGMELVGTNDATQLAQLQHSMDLINAEIERARTDLDEAVKSVMASKLSEPIEELATVEQLNRITKLREIETRKVETEVRLAQSEIAKKSAIDAWGTNPQEVEITPADFRIIDDYLIEYQAIGELLKKLDLEEKLPANTGPVTSLDILAAAMEALRNWKAAEAATTGTNRWFAIIPAILGVAGLLWIFIESQENKPGLLLLAFAIGMLAMNLFGFRKLSSARPARYRKDYEDSGLESPLKWDRESVTTRLRELEVDWKLAREAEIEKERKQTHNSQRQRLKRQQEDLDNKVRPVKEKLGLNIEITGSRLLDVINKLKALRDANTKNEELLTARNYLASEHEKTLQTLNSFLLKHGEGVVTDCAAASTAIEGLSRRSSALCAARDKELTASSNIKARTKEAERIQGQLEKFWNERNLAFGAIVELQTRLESKEHWDRAKKDIYNNERQKDELSRKLESRQELLSLSLEEIQASIQARRAETDSLEALVKDHTEIASAVKAAFEGHDVENAKAILEANRIALRSKAEEVIQSHLGGFLLKRIEQAHRRKSQPELLTETGRLFSLFTNDKYELDIDVSEQIPTLRVKELDTGDWKSLSELSAATRLQLLLSSRLAFAQSQEKGEPVPFFLDEVLSNSDPSRFRAVAQSLGKLADSGERQIFYMTSNPADVTAWAQSIREMGGKEPTVVDLGEIRKISGAVRDASLLRLPPIVVPDSKGVSREQYGLLLKVPAVDDQAPVDALHLFYVIGEDLESLRKLISAGIYSVGQWRSASAGRTAFALCGETRGKAISAAVLAADVILSKWKVGRGKRLSPDIFEFAGLSEKSQAQVRELAKKLDWDSKKIMTAIDERTDPVLKGFLKAQGDKLRDYLTNEDFLDDRETLSNEQILALAIEASIGSIQSGITTAEEIRQLGLMLLRCLEKTPSETILNAQ